MNDIPKWLGNIFIMSSAVLVSFSTELAITWWAFCGFFVGHIFWIYSSAKDKQIPLLSLNIFFICLDMWAIYIRL